MAALVQRIEDALDSELPHEVIAVQYGLNSFEEDVATVKRTLNRVGSPVLLVGHSYGGATITA
jgi:predicted alpha/beta hydrolase family esterase